MKLIIAVMVMLLPLLSASAQAQAIKPLKIGDTVPGITIHNLVNYETTSFKLNDTGKPMLLDFFATWCSGCIAALPYFNSLREALKDSFQVWVVCTEPADKIRHLLQTNGMLKNIRLPFITSDSLLYRLFPHHAIPHEAWIGRDGVVKAITIAEYVNKDNLQKLVAGKPLHLPVKTDAQHYDPSLSLTDNALSRQSPVLFRSALTGFVNNAARGITGTSLSEDGKYRRWYFINMTPVTLCMAALDYRFSRNRFVLEICDTSKFADMDKQHDWFITHALSYELTVPLNTPLWQAAQHILNDIGEATRTQIRVEKRQMPCYALIRDREHQLKDPQSRGEAPRAVFISENGKPVYIHNLPLSGLLKAMNAGTFDQPQPIIIDESGYSLPVHMDLGTINIKDIAAVKKALWPYGFNLIKVSRPLDMVVISGSHTQNK